MSEIRQRLFALQDLGYKGFQSKLMPTVDPDRVIGVRMPLLRAFAKEIVETPEANAFLRTLPHDFYEENNLHGLLIERIKNYDRVLVELDAFLPYIDNWATCDLISPKILRFHLPKFIRPIKHWIGSEHTYTIRFGIGMMLKFYLDEAFDPAYLALVADIRSNQYYVNMMIAWYFATALAKQYESALPFVSEHRLDGWTHNKTIQKAIESDRISNEKKIYLRSFRIKSIV